MKREQKKGQKRATILCAAQETFCKDGYIGASMDRIASAAGVTKQTLYRYFPSKEVLFQASLEEQRNTSRSRFLEELDRPDAREALERFATGFLEVHMSEEHLAVIRLLISEGPAAPEITRIHFAHGPRKTEIRLARFLSERFGINDPEYAIRMLMSTLLSMRLSVLIGLHPVPTREEMVRHARRTVDTFWPLVSRTPPRDGDVHGP